MKTENINAALDDEDAPENLSALVVEDYGCRLYGRSKPYRTWETPISGRKAEVAAISLATVAIASC